MSGALFWLAALAVFLVFGWAGLFFATLALVIIIASNYD